MSCAALLVFVTFLILEDLRNLMKKPIIRSPQEATIISDQPKLGLSQSITLASKPVQKLLKQMYGDLDGEDTPIFRFTQDNWRKEIHSMKHENCLSTGQNLVPLHIHLDKEVPHLMI